MCVCVTNGENNDAHKFQYFPNIFKVKVVEWFVRFETTNPTTWLTI
jgi:hypothetical protein